jgi:hypothetical protein
MGVRIIIAAMLSALLWGQDTSAPVRIDGKEVVRIYAREWAYSSRRAEEELDYTITPLEEGVSRTVQWLRREGHLRA